MKIGKQLKNLRKGKNYTQNFVSSEDMNRSTYSKIESDRMVPTINKLTFILEKLNVSYDEFFYIVNDYQLTDYQLITQKFRSLSLNIDIKPLYEIIDLSNDYLSKSEDYTIRDINYICQALISFHKNEWKEANSFAKKVWKRLEQMDQWSLTELFLINHILFIFSIETAVMIMRQVMKTIDRYSNFKDSHRLKYVLLINFTLYCLKTKNAEVALEAINKALETCDKNNDINYLPYIYIRKGQAMFLRDKQEALNLMIKGLQILKLVGKYDLAKLFISEIKQNLSIEIEKEM